MVLIFTNQIQISKQWGLADFWWMKVWVGRGEILVLIFPNQNQIRMRKQWGLANLGWMKVWVREDILVLIFTNQIQTQIIHSNE